MAERRARRRWIAFAGALVCALLGVAFLGWSISQHEDARSDLKDARTQLATNQVRASKEAKALQRAQAAIGTVRDQLAALDQGASGLADLDQRDFEAVAAAVRAGLAGSLADYNAAVDRRVALDPQHDAALEQLRQQANSVIVALNGVR